MATADRRHSAQLLDSYYDTVVGLLENSRCDQVTEARLFTLASSLAQTIGWHRFDHDRHTAAGHYWSAALHAAHQVGDGDRGAGLLSDLAYQNIWLGQAGTAIDVLDMLCPVPRTPPPAPCSTCARPGPWPWTAMAAPAAATSMRRNMPSTPPPPAPQVPVFAAPSARRKTTARAHFPQYPRAVGRTSPTRLSRPLGVSGSNESRYRRRSRSAAYRAETGSSAGRCCALPFSLEALVTTGARLDQPRTVQRPSAPLK